MTSRERVLAALDHKQTDRVPVDFGGHRSSGIMAIAYAKLVRALGLPMRPIKVYDVVQQLAAIDDDVLDRLGVDVVEMGRGFDGSPDDWKEWILPDGTPCLVPPWADLRLEDGNWWLYNRLGRKAGVQKRGSLYFEQVWWPYAEGIPDDLSGLDEAVASVQWSMATPPNLETTSLDELARGAKAFRSSTERAIIFLFGGSLYELAQYLCGTENFLVWMGTEPEAVHRLLDAILESHLADLRRLMPIVGPFVDIVLFGDDFGMQTGLQMSPTMYRHFFKERERILWGEAKRLAGIRTQLHCCGGVRDILGDLIELDLDSINPVQTSCAGMEPAGLKQDFGAGITFWGGGCDTQTVLTQATPGEVRAHVLGRLPVMEAGSGFVFQQVHNVMANVSPENILAMFSAVAEHNRRRQDR